MEKVTGEIRELLAARFSNGNYVGSVWPRDPFNPTPGVVNGDRDPVKVVSALERGDVVRVYEINIKGWGRTLGGDPTVAELDLRQYDVEPLDAMKGFLHELQNHLIARDHGHHSSTR